MAFRWRADDGPTLNAGLVAVIFQGIRTCIASKSYIFVIFEVDVRTPCPASGSAHVGVEHLSYLEWKVDNEYFACKVMQTIWFTFLTSKRQYL